MTPQEIVAKFTTPRTKEIERLTAYDTSKQYEGRPDWHDHAQQVPAILRKPCVNFPVTRIGIRSHTSFVLGEGRFPTLSTGAGEDDSDLDSDWGLTEDQSKTFDSFLNKILVKYARLKTKLRCALSGGLASKSAAIVISLQQGVPKLDILCAAYCEPELDALGNCLSLKFQQIQLDDKWDDKTQKWIKVPVVYRRRIDSIDDVCFKPAEIIDRGAQTVLPAAEPDPAKSMRHGFGVCPVVWYSCLSDEQDGVALVEQSEGNIDCLNVALSQKQNGAGVAANPQKFETGVSEDEQPGPSAGGSFPAVNPEAIKRARDTYGLTANMSGGPTKRITGPGAIWTYRNPETKVGQLALPGDALKGSSEHCEDLRNKIGESMSVVNIDPTNMKMHAALSGKAMALMYSKQLAFDDQLREDFGDTCILPLVSLLLRILYTIQASQPGKLRVPGIDKLMPILSGFEVQEETGEVAQDGRASTRGTWLMPRLDLQWGPYFEDDAQAELFTVQLVVAAYQASVISLQVAVEKLLQTGVFDAESAAELVEQIQTESAEKQQQQIDLALATKPPPGAPPGGGGKPAAKPNGAKKPAARPS